MKKLLFIAVLFALIATPIFALSDDAKFTYSVLPEDQRRKNGSPFKEDAIALAKETGTIRVYFMHGEGIEMDSSTGTKWGDATLIVFPNGETMLIDGGMEKYSRTLVHNIEELGIDTIDHVILSHNHPDHFGGLCSSNGALAKFKVKNFYWSGLNCDYNKNQAKVFNNAFKKYIEKKNVNDVVLTAGDVFYVGEAKVEVLNPSAENKEGYHNTIPAAQSERMNNESLAIKITYKDFSAMFCGDMYQARELELVEEYGDKLEVDLMKANHHGKDTSNAKEWAKASSPRIVVAMYGYQMDGTAYCNYAETGSYVFAEYYDGYIRVVSDGESYCDTVCSKERETILYKFYDTLAQAIYPLNN